MIHIPNDNRIKQHRQQAVDISKKMLRELIECSANSNQNFDKIKNNILDCFKNLQLNIYQFINPDTNFIYLDLLIASINESNTYGELKNFMFKLENSSHYDLIICQAFTQLITVHRKDNWKIIDFNKYDNNKTKKLLYFATFYNKKYYIEDSKEVEDENNENIR